MKTIVVSLLLLPALLIAAAITRAQSTDQMFPTPVRTAEISNSIKARAIGDPRLTSYYYTFEGEQGDLFVNVQSKNFTGDIDVYIVPSQQPLTKIVIYGDQPEAETGRVLYLRKPERLLLRIQGRSPGDDDASLRIKFAGSFSASKLNDTDDPAVPKVESAAESSVRVNAVGTILEVISKAAPTPDAARLETAPERHESREALATKKDDERELPAVDAERVVITDPVGQEKKKAAPGRTTTPQNRNPRRATAAASKAVPAVERSEGKEAGPEKRAAARVPDRRSSSTESESTTVDPMAGINLVIYFKDGSTINRPMTDVSRFAVERAVLTVISKNGTVGRYNMMDVSRVSIE